MTGIWEKSHETSQKTQTEKHQIKQKRINKTIQTINSIHASQPVHLKVQRNVLQSAKNQ